MQFHLEVHYTKTKDISKSFTKKINHTKVMMYFLFFIYLFFHFLFFYLFIFSFVFVFIFFSDLFLSIPKAFVRRHYQHRRSNPILRVVYVT